MGRQLLGHRRARGWHVKRAGDHEHDELLVIEAHRGHAYGVVLSQVADGDLRMGI